MSAVNNKWLVVRDGVVLTPSIEPVIIGLDGYFESAKLRAQVTSGKRTPEEQLALIKFYALKFNIDSTYPSILTATLTGKLLFDNKQVFEWQPAWAELLRQGVIINPPLKAICLFDYTVNGMNKKGKIIDQSVHSRGGAFDIGGASGTAGIDDELRVIERAYASRKIQGWLGYKVERKNNCIHCDCVIV